MPYRLHPRRPVGDEIGRVAEEQIDKALVCLGAAENDLETAIHDTRKCCKRLRGLLRLARSAIGDDCYRHENVVFRDIARELSTLRDEHAMLGALDDLKEWRPDAFDHAAARRALSGRRRCLGRKPMPVRRAEQGMREARERLGDWPLESRGFDALGKGLQRNYRRARDGYRVASKPRRTEDLHEWRKRVKYHWYHLRLLEPAWPKVIRGYRKAFKTLSDLLGDDHDLAVLGEYARERAERFAGPDQLAALEKVISTRRKVLQHDAFELGARAHAERPKRLRQRIGGYWRAAAQRQA